MSTRRVAYLHSDELLRAADKLPSNAGRASAVHRLTTAILPAFNTVEPEPATERQLKQFHASRLVARLLHQEISESEASDDEGPARKKRRKSDSSVLQHDVPDFAELPEYVTLVAGASMTGARLLRERQADVAINWTGGRHHARKDRAAGFCYVSDIALAVMEMRKAPIDKSLSRLERILIVDLDVHAGDGVSESFWSSANVLTLSVHHHAVGFYPISCPLDATGPPAPSAAAHRSLNIALPRPGFDDATLARLWQSCVEPVKEAFKPDAVVFVMGADGLAGDPVGVGNYSSQGLLKALESVLEWRLPLLLLGAGGYDNRACARLWASATAVASGTATLEECANMSIPESCPDWPKYGPLYSLNVEASSRRNKNTEEDLKAIEQAFEAYVQALRPV